MTHFLRSALAFSLALTLSVYSISSLSAETKAPPPQRTSQGNIPPVN